MPAYDRSIALPLCLALALAAAPLGIAQTPAPADATQPPAPPAPADAAPPAAKALSPAPALVPIRVDLASAIRRAVVVQPSVVASRYGPKIAAAEVLQARGSYDPKLTLTFTNGSDGNPQATDPTTGTRPPGTVVDTDTRELAVSGLTPWGLTYRVGASSQNVRGTYNGFADQFYTFGGISVTQPLLRDFGTASAMATLRLARADRSISQWEFRQTLIDTITSVIDACANVELAQLNLQSARQSRDLAAKLLSDNEARFRAGSMSEYDVTSARSRVASREEAILIADRALKDAENRLKQLVTADRSPALLSTPLVLAPLPPVDVPETIDPAADMPRALTLRPDYQQARLSLAQAKIGRASAHSAALPRLDLIASYGYNGLDDHLSSSFDQVRDRQNRSYSVGAVMSVPLTFATERGRYRAARLRADQAEAYLAALEQGIVVAVGNAAGAVETARQRVAAAQEARKLTERSLDAELKKLRAGTGSTFFVLEEQEKVAVAEVSEAQANADLRHAVAEYDRQLGTTLERWKVEVDE